MSEVARILLFASEPPTITTRPSESKAAAWDLRAEESAPTNENAPEAGSKISADWLMVPEEPCPPVMRTRPSLSRTAAAPARASSMPPVTPDQEFSVGSKISAEFATPPDVKPPATRMRPSLSTTEMWLLRGAPISGAAKAKPSLPTKSAVAVGPAPVSPPVIRTRPSWRGAADAPARGWDIAPPDAQVPVGTWSTPAFTRCPREISPRMRNNKIAVLRRIRSSLRTRKNSIQEGLWCVAAGRHTAPSETPISYPRRTPQITAEGSAGDATLTACSRHSQGQWRGAQSRAYVIDSETGCSHSGMHPSSEKMGKTGKP